MDIAYSSSYPEGGLPRVFGDTDRSKYGYYGDGASNTSQTSTAGYTQAYQSAVNSYAEGTCTW
ncbi:hypothetical protein DPMN_127536 [Dreissena polymorpha]|uniref:Uncharacterized protein n=1 Tax=Dreissena polymorpha TaxID=45954 RepID=A0A9D4GZ48_DREPO|nr:hypothetical protein DPMN_127536 [Dreissena polymorpha]